jgi:hypothetical protein
MTTFLCKGMSFSNWLYFHSNHTSFCKEVFQMTFMGTASSDNPTEEVEPWETFPAPTGELWFLYFLGFLILAYSGCPSLHSPLWHPN